MWLIFIKEALLLWRLSSRKVVKILGVCETPISIMMGQLEFSFVPFGRDIKKVNFSEKLLDLFDSTRQRHCQWYNQCSMLPSSKWYSLMRY